jgi:hypothetical protein
MNSLRRRTTMNTAWITAALAGVLAGAVPAAGQDERVNIPVTEVPKLLGDLVKKHLPEGSITEATRRVRKNEEEYRLRIFLAGRIVEGEFDLELNGGPAEGRIELPVTSTDVPKAVAEAFTKALPDTPLPKALKVITIDETLPEGRSTYEWKLKDPKREVVISSDGATTTVLQRIKEEELPAAVREALNRDHAGVKIKKIDRAAVNGVVSYHLDLSGADDLVATADGKISVKEE